MTWAMAAPWAWGAPVVMGVPRAMGAPLVWEAVGATGAPWGTADPWVMEAPWATEAPWAMGATRGPSALATVGGPTALASPPVARVITSLAARDGAGPAVGAAGLSKAPVMVPGTSKSPEARTTVRGGGARGVGSSVGTGGGWMCPAAHYPVSQSALSLAIPWVPPSPRPSPAS